MGRYERVPPTAEVVRVIDDIEITVLDSSNTLATEKEVLIVFVQQVDLHK